MMAVPGESLSPGASLSSEVHKAGKRRKAAMQIETEFMEADSLWCYVVNEKSS